MILHLRPTFARFFASSFFLLLLFIPHLVPPSYHASSSRTQPNLRLSFLLSSHHPPTHFLFHPFFHLHFKLHECPPGSGNQASYNNIRTYARTSTLHSHILYRTYILVGQSVLGLFLSCSGSSSCFQNICVHFRFNEVRAVGFLIASKAIGGGAYTIHECNSS